MARLIVQLVSFYQRTLSPDHGFMRAFYPNGFCRFHPSCSEYTKQAVQKYGLSGLFMGLKRLVRCNPYSKGGVDPVS